MLLDGTFLQLGSHHKSWTEAKWSELFEHFQRLRLSQVVLQWTACDDVAFYNSSTGNPDSVLHRMLAVASRTGLKVWIGLYQDSQYWNRIDRDPASVAAYLRQLRSRSLAIARDLAPSLDRHPSFAGWYFSEEIDDVNWRSAAARKELLLHLNLASSGLHGLTPDAKIAISGFSNARVSPGQFHEFWKDVFAASSVNTLFLQDGVGVHKLEPDEFPLYAGAAARAARTAGRDFSVVVELFRQVAGAPLDSAEFQAVPASWPRVRRQLEAARKFTRSIVGFSVPEYMSPFGTKAAEQLYLEYLGEVRGQAHEHGDGHRMRIH